MVPAIAVVYFYPHFSYGLLLLGFPWLITVAGSLILFAKFFKEKLNVRVEKQ
jgi:hypothetical protein